jgi:hypothetical protein
MTTGDDFKENPYGRPEHKNPHKSFSPAVAGKSGWPRRRGLTGKQI